MITTECFMAINPVFSINCYIYQHFSCKKLAKRQKNLYICSGKTIKTIIVIMNKKYDSNLIPPSWGYCFNAQCPMHESCLRFQSAAEIPEKRELGPAVYPTAYKNGQCRFYRKDEKVTLATGFVIEGNPRATNMFIEKRSAITNYLGGNGTYYLYRNGKKWLSPQQQEDIRNIFRRAGYTDEVVFGYTKEEYDFT